MNPYTQTRVDRIVEEVYHGGMNQEALRALILTVLKEQDRDTRHACAEAVANCAKTHSTLLYVRFDEAHSACLNVQAV